VIQREIRATMRQYGIGQALALGELSDRVVWLENEVARLGSHVAAQGERLGIVEQGYRPVGGEPVAAAAQEHERARVRSAYVSQMEERLNRVEAFVTEARRSAAR
jgi:hypothetical protein